MMLTPARAAVLFVFAWAALASPWLSGAVTIPWDAKAHWYPHLVATSRAFHAGQSPFWMPQIFLGSPEIADPQSVLFSPPLLALAWLVSEPSPAALDRMVFTVLALGGLGLMALFRDRGWHPLGALVAAIVFCFGASAAWRIQHINQVMALACWPVIAWALARALTRQTLASRLGHGIVAGLVAGMMVASRDQVALLLVYLLVAQVLVAWAYDPRRIPATLPGLSLGAMAGLAIALPPVWLTWQWSLESNRALIDLAGAGRGSLHPGHLLTLAIGNLYGGAGELANHWGPPSLIWTGTDLFLARNMAVIYCGAIPLLVLFALVRTGAIFDREIRFFAIALAVMLIYALGKYTPAHALFWALPGVDFYRRPADATFIMGGLVAVLAGYGVHRLAAGTLPTTFRNEGIGCAAVLALGAGLIVGMGAPATAWMSLAIAAVSIGLSWAALRVRPRALIALPLLLVADLAVTNGPSESTALPPSTYAVLTPGQPNETIALAVRLITRDDARRDRIEVIAMPYHWQNVTLARDLEETLGFNPVRSAAISSILGAGDIALPGARTFPPAFPGYTSHLARRLGLAVIISGQPITTIDPTATSPKLVARTAEAYVYSVPDPGPRVFVATATRPTPANLATAGFPGDLSPGEVLVEGSVPRSAGGRARLMTYRPDHVEIETDAPAPGLLVLADAWHPWWQASVNDTPTPILRVDGLIRGVEVPAGRARVVMHFTPGRSGKTRTH